MYRKRQTACRQQIDTYKVLREKVQVVVYYFLTNSNRIVITVRMCTRIGSKQFVEDEGKN